MEGNNLFSSTISTKLNICVRARPVIPEDKKLANVIRNAPEICVHFNEDGQTIKLIKDQYHSKSFRLDHSFSSATNQILVYQSSLKPVVDDVIKGYNGSGIVYGQTSSGKTYTMFGNGNKPGIAHLAMDDIFDVVRQYESCDLIAKVHISFYQIYLEQVYDLLSPSNAPNSSGNDLPPSLPIREDNLNGVYIERLTQIHAKDRESAYEIIHKGLKNRKVNSTTYNMRSSRSHAILQISLELEEKSLPESLDNYQPSGLGSNSPSLYEKRFLIRRSKLMLVDLAGSERQLTYRHNSKRQMQEAANINKSISALGNCISALSNNELNNKENGHIPYRDCKLTRLLAESLGGNARTCIIATINPCSYSYEETMSTLKFAMRAKTVKKIIKKNTQREEVIQTPLSYTDQEIDYDQMLGVEGGEEYSEYYSQRNYRINQTTGDDSVAGSYDSRRTSSLYSRQSSPRKNINSNLFSSPLPSPGNRSNSAYSRPPSPSITRSVQPPQNRYVSPGPDQRFIGRRDDIQSNQFNKNTKSNNKFTLKDFLHACSLANKAILQPEDQDVLECFEDQDGDETIESTYEMEGQQQGPQIRNSPIKRDLTPPPINISSSLPNGIEILDPFSEHASPQPLYNPQLMQSIQSPHPIKSFQSRPSEFSPPFLDKPILIDDCCQTEILSPTLSVSKINRNDGTLDDFKEFEYVDQSECTQTYVEEIYWPIVENLPDRELIMSLLMLHPIELARNYIQVQRELEQKIEDFDTLKECLK